MKYISLLCFVIWAGVVTAQTESELDSIYRKIGLDDIIVTAQYAPTHSKNAVHQVRVIKAEEFRLKGQNNLAEVLTNQLNLNVTIDPILGNGLKIQGIGGENIQILIDGVPIIGRTDGNIDLSQINLQDADRIEIIEGAMSAQYGSNASGGVINIITKKSQLKTWRVHSQNQYENIGIWNNDLSIGFQKDRWYASVGANRNTAQFALVDSLRLLETIDLADGTTFLTKVYPWNPKTQISSNGKLQYRPSDSLKITYQFRYFNEDLSLYGTERRSQFEPYAFDEYFNTQRSDHSFNIEVYPTANFYVNSTTAYNIYDRNSQEEWIDLTTDTLVAIIPNGGDTSRFTNFLHRTTLNHLGGHWLNAQLGLEALHETGSGQRILDSTAVNPNIAEFTNLATWLSLQWDLRSNLTIQGNLRYGYNSKYDHPLVPSINLNWQPTTKCNVKLNYANGFRAPSLKELYFNFIDTNHFIVGNPNLRAERSHNAAAIFTYKNSHRDLPWGATAKLFYNHIRDRIITTEFASFQFNYQNIESFETHGINLRGHIEINENLHLQSGYALTRLSNNLSDANHEQRFSTLDEWQNELHYHFPILAANLSLTHRYIGNQIRFTEDIEGKLEESFAGNFHLINATLSRRFWQERLLLVIGGKNLLNVQSLPTSGGGSGAHSSSSEEQLFNWGRTFFVRLEIDI